MIEEPPAEDASVTTIPDEDQPIVAVTSEEEKYLICDCCIKKQHLARFH